MKKFFLWLLMVIGVVAIVVFGTYGYAYYKTDENAVPSVNIAFGGVAIAQNGYDWNASVLNGLIYKPSKAPRTLTVTDLGTFDTVNIGLKTDENVKSAISISDKSGVLFNGSAAEFSSFTFEKNGDYTLQAQLDTIPLDGESYGSFYYDAKFKIAVEPKITLSAERIEQGGVISVIVTDNLENAPLDIKSDLGLSLFTKVNGVDTAFVPVAYNREPGEYVIDIRVGDLVITPSVEIIHRDFERQDMTIDQDIADSTANSAAANAEFNKKIVSLYFEADPQTYWNGLFKQPCEGRITSEFGLRRYTNGAKTPVRHGGLDIATPAGTPVLSPNNGRVLFAEFIALTGNTVVLEHGAGLKSYFYHMESLSVEAGAMVKTGDEIGKVGTTGYSTGAHLHYEVKIGNQSINPWQLFDGTSGIFYEK